MFFPPLVEPSAHLSPAQLERAARQVRLPQIGRSGQARLAAAHVLVMGAGGLGSPVLQYLAAAGIGTITIVDDDAVDATNLHRQVLFGVDDVGRPKTEAAAERLKGLAPDIRIVQERTRVTAENAAAVFAGANLVIDGTDSFDTRYVVADACDELGVPLVWGSVLRFDAQATVFWSAPPAGRPVRMRDVFPAAPKDAPSCAEAGVIGAVCGQLGALLAMEAIKLICGIGDPLVGRMAVIDALRGSVREIPLAAQPAASLAVVSLERARDDGRTLLDVRSHEEVAAGMLTGAQHMPVETVLADPASAAEKLGETRVAVYCHAGPRARSAARALAAAGVDAAVLSGGWADYGQEEA